MTALRAGKGRPLTGEARVPGDKSISHRALMTGAVAIGETVIDGLLEGDDVLRTAAALRAMGVAIARDGARWRVQGVGVGGLAEPEEVLDMGNSGTGARLLMGLVATHPFTSHFTGDASLVKRPMARVAEPLMRMGADFLARPGCRLPLAVRGTDSPIPIEYRLPVASAQVKSAILYAALNTPGATTVIEQHPTRDHSERMLAHFGAEIRVETLPGGARAVTVTGERELTSRAVNVPADISSAAFPLVAALLVPGSRVRLPGVGVNPLRTGLLDTLAEMGADLHREDERDVAGEPVADLIAQATLLRAVDVPAERAPRMIDEYPVLAVAAACASGTSRFRGLAELRVKESDRLSAVARGLTACGVNVEVQDDDLIVHGTGGAPPGAARIEADLDHRIAMAFLVMGMAAEGGVEIDDGSPIDTSFPNFVPLMRALGADVA